MKLMIVFVIYTPSHIGVETPPSLWQSDIE